jgi:O-antigen/teichoic acid export membrane protein
MTGDRSPLGPEVNLARDTRRYYWAALIPTAASVTAVTVFTRVFGAAEYGRYAVVLAASSILAVVLGAWIQQAVLRYLPRSKSDVERAAFVSGLSGLLVIVCVVVGGAAAITYLLLRSSLGAYRPLYVAAAALLVGEIAFLSLNTTQQAGLRSGAYARYRVSDSILRLGFSLALVFFVARDVTSLLVGAAIAHLLLLLPMARGVGIRRISLDASMARAFLAFGLPMVGWLMGGQLLALSDRFVIGAFRETAEVGVYSANYNLVTMGFGVLTAPLLMATHPFIMNAWEAGRRDEVPAIIRRFTGYYALAALPLLAVVVVFSREIVSILLGPEFREGHKVIPLVMAGSALWGAAMYGHKGLEVMEKTRVMMALVTVSAALNLALNFVFVPRYGYTAAATTTLVGYASYPILVHWVGRRHLRWRVPWRTVSIAVLAAGVMSVVMYVFGRTVGAHSPWLILVGGSAIGFLSYAALLYVTRQVRASDLVGLFRGGRS